MVYIHFTGCGYYYANAQGKQLSKHYKYLGNLKKYGVINQ